MNLFLAQKTNPSKSKLAKIFAVFLVCFFVIIITHKSEAATVKYYKDNVTKEVYQEISVVQISGAPLGGAPNRYTYTYFKVDAQGQTEIKPPNNAPSDWSPLPDRANLTTLPLDPIAVNNHALGSLMYDYEGAFYYDSKTNQKWDPYEDREVLLQKAEQLAPGVKRNADGTLGPIPKTYDQSQTDASYNADRTGNPNKAPPPNDMECGWKELDCLFAKMIYIITIGPAGLLLSASGWLMSKTFEITVVNLARTLGENGSFRPVIQLVWGMFRDIINITFIFLLLYASIMTILKADTSRIKSMVGKVVVVAILINFSLFFTTAIIDTSNVLAVGIYNQINQGASPGNNNLAAAFLKQLKLDSLLTDAKGFGGEKAYGKMITICIFGSVFILVLAVMFFVISVLFIIRFATLLMLMMMSPLGIGVIAIPKLEKAFDGGYWGNLLSQCFFAPIMILFLWISIKLLEGIVKLGGPNPPPIASSLTDPDTAKNYLGTFLLGFVVLIIILIKGIEFSKSLSAKGAGALQSGVLKYSGADRLQNYMKNAPRNVGAAAGGAAARNTAGRMATRFADSEWMRNKQTTAFGRLVNKGARSVADAGFGGKQGFAKNEAESIKQREKLRDTLDKKSFAEQEAIEAQKERVRAESAKELEHTTSASEANTVHSASQALTGHTKDKTDLEEKKQLAEALVKQQTDYLNDPTTQANAAHKKAAEDSLKKAADELEKVESEIENLDDALIKAFKSANIEIDPKDLASIANAKTALDAKNADLALKAGLDASANSKDVAKAYSKMAEKQKAATETERTGLKAVEDAIKAQSKARQEQYAKSLSSRGLNNLFIPSKAARQAAMNVRREANKTSDERDKDEMNRLMKKLLAEKEKEGGGAKGKEEKKDK